MSLAYAKTYRGVDKIKVLAIRQPWAYAILHLGKDVENRSWRTHYRGPLLIHAAYRRARNPREMLSEYMTRPPSEKSLRDLPIGRIVGVVDLVDCIKNSKGKWAERGAWHWVLKNPRPFLTPAECTGRLGLWTPPARVIRKLPKRLGGAERGA